MKSPALTILTAAIVLSLATTGCHPTPAKPTPTPAQPSTTPTLTPTPSPNPTTDEDRAAAKVVEAMRLHDEIAQRVPGRKIDDMYTVSRDTMAKGWVEELIRMRNRDRVQHGFVEVQPLSSVLGEGNTFAVKVCEDWSKGEVVDAEGKNVLPSDSPRPGRNITIYQVIKAPEGFFVIDGRDAGTC